MNRNITMSQRTAKESLGNPDAFKGGCLVTKNGVAELYIQTIEEREQEENALESARQANALLKLAMLAKEDVENGRIYSEEEVLQKLRAARR